MSPPWVAALPPPITRVELDKLGCQCGRPGCVMTAQLRPMCHPNAEIRAWYVVERGSIVLSCVTCEQGFAHIQVAAQVPS